MDTCQESPPKGGISLLLQGGGGEKNPLPTRPLPTPLPHPPTHNSFLFPPTTLSHTHKKTPSYGRKGRRGFAGEGKEKLFGFYYSPSFPPLRLETGGGLREHFRKREFSRLKH